MHNADRYSGFPLVERFNKDPTAGQTISRLRKWFSLMGAPNVLRSDSGPQYSSHETQEFLKTWGVQWIPSSPEHAASNGHAESIVKAVKHLLLKCDGDYDGDAFHKGLLELRNAPRSDGQSPAMRLFGKPLRSNVPINWRHFDQKWQNAFAEADISQETTKRRARTYYDRQAKQLPKFEVGDSVLVQDPDSLRWSKPATVVATDGNRGRRYQLRFNSGRILWRNRSYLTRRH